MSIFPSKLWSRRHLLKQSGMLSAIGAAATMAPLAASAASSGSLEETQVEAGVTNKLAARQGTDADNLFTQIGVRPILNAAWHLHHHQRLPVAS